jgi:transposase
VDENERRKNRTKARVRFKVEWPFRILKRVFGYTKVRYRGLKKSGEVDRAGRRDGGLARKFQQLTSILGIAETSAVQLLGELAGLDPEMTVRQWVAFSGLDPAHQVSGTSVHRPSRISRHGNRHLRRALYMPALVGARFDAHLKAFYLQLQERHKTKLQALIAVARKMLHAIYGIFKTGTPYDGAKLFPNLIPTS